MTPLRRRAAKVAVVLSVVALIVVAVTNAIVLSIGGERVYTRAGDVPPRAVAIVLGAGLSRDGRPSVVLLDRLETSLDLYRRGKVRRLLVTGDNGTDQYDEVTAMERWLVAHGVDPRHVQRDHAGFRTLDSMVRAVKVFQVRHAVVVTQRFHMARSLFLARDAGLDAVGAVADRRPYHYARRYALRELGARAVAVFDAWVIHRRPRVLGPPIPVET